MIKSIIWNNNHLQLLDQRVLPFKKEYISLYNFDQVIESIKSMIVRGAPAIAITGLYGICLYLNNLDTKVTFDIFEDIIQRLINSRPTAVNLRKNINELLYILKPIWMESTLESLRKITLDFSNKTFEEDLSINENISNNGSNLFKGKDTLTILTHCNTGSIATAGIGTALGVIKKLHSQKKIIKVYVSETRPYHQGSRLTAWELGEEGIDYDIITDSMSGFIMKNYKVDAVIVGADRIAKNGDTANKIGTYTHAIIANHHKIPFFVACSRYSFDPNIEKGDNIEIEYREASELTQNSFLRNEENQLYLPEGILAPINAKALNPSFDITPNFLISGLITEKGIISPVDEENIKLYTNLQ